MSLQYSSGDIFSFPTIGDERGSLISLESEKNIPFKIARVYYIFDTANGVSRGFHAHKRLEQILICVSGSCEVVLDDGHQKKQVNLSDPSYGLYIGSDCWRVMKSFSKDCVLLVLASSHYDESDYIRNYDDFLSYLKER